MPLTAAQQVLQTYIMGRVGSPFRSSKISGLTAADRLFVGFVAAAREDDCALILASWLSRLTEPRFQPWYVWVAELAREFAARGCVSGVGRFGGLSPLCTAPLRGEFAPPRCLDEAFESAVRPVVAGGPTTPQGAAGVCAHLHALAYGTDPPAAAVCDDLCIVTHPAVHYRAD